MFSAQLSYDVKIEARSATRPVMPNGRSSGGHCDEAQQAAGSDRSTQRPRRSLTEVGSTASMLLSNAA